MFDFALGRYTLQQVVVNCFLSHLSCRLDLFETVFVSDISSSRQVSFLQQLKVKQRAVYLQVQSPSLALILIPGASRYSHFGLAAATQLRPC